MSVKSTLTPAEVEAEYGIAEKTLANWRYLGTGPEYTKKGTARCGRIRYRRSAIEAWFDDITVTPSGVP